MPRRRTTLKDVAEAVGVHVSTVSRALNPATRHFIRAEVTAKILEASASLNYRPNAAAYSLRTNRTHIIGVVIPDIANPVFPPIIRGIENVLSEHGYMAMLVNTDTRSARQASLIGALHARGIDGLIVASLERNDSTVRAIADDGLPVILGTRPEHLTLVDSGGIPVRVVVMEPTGMDTFIACRHEGVDLAAVFRERHDFAPGTTIRLLPDLQRAHLFDASTGQRLAA
mgnify:CR=1 FL=1